MIRPDYEKLARDARLLPPDEADIQALEALFSLLSDLDASEGEMPPAQAGAAAPLREDEPAFCRPLAEGEITVPRVMEADQ